MFASLVKSYPKRLPVVLRALATNKSSLGPDPLQVLLNESLARNLCDPGGNRMPGVHWVMSIAVTPEDSTQAPSLRTVGIERVNEGGIDFGIKRGTKASKAMAAGRPVSVLYSQGKYLPGEKAEQWRGEGHCERLPLQDILHLIPHFTLTSIVGSRRLAAETDATEDRVKMSSRAHTTEVMQKTRLDLENGLISQEELNDSVRAFRFIPDRIECMVGGPDNIFWERFEWMRDNEGNCPEGTLAWKDPEQIVPH